MATYGIIPHRLIPGVSGVPADAENLSVVNTNAGGFGTADWDQRSAPSLAAHDAVEINIEGRIFEGKVAAVTGGIGETLSWHVSCVGHFDELKNDETVERVFVDRDMSLWQGADCNNWSVAPDFQINLDAEGGLKFSWPAVDTTMVYQSATATHYIDHVGNAVPYKKAGDFPKPDALWTAACYQIGGHQRITGLSFELSYYMIFDGMYQMKTSDYTSPIGPPDEKYGHRFSKYPQIGYWYEFYKAATHGNVPKPLYFGAYVCDKAEDLPVADPIAMRSDPRALIIIDHGLCGIDWMSEGMGGPDPMKLRFPCDGKIILFYATYLPVQLPFNLSTKYSKNADHLVRTKWVARNRIFNPFAGVDSNWINVKNVSVYANGYESEDDGSDDLADVFTILFPTCEVENMPLPAPIDDTAPTSIVLRQATTKLAAITELLGLYPAEMCWGVWEDKVLQIKHDAGAVSVSDEPGVDTTGAALSDEGAVDLVLVEYTPSAPTPAPGALQLASTAFVIVDLEGSYELVEDGWEPGEGVRATKVDATGYAHSEIAAARAGQMVAISRRAGQWTGSVPLHAIAGGSAIRPGALLSAPGINGALITQTSVNVDGDSVSLSLGNTGYIGRFPARVPGKPLTASPHVHESTSNRPARRSGGGRR